MIKKVQCRQNSITPVTERLGVPGNSIFLVILCPLALFMIFYTYCGYRWCQCAHRDVVLKLFCCILHGFFGGLKPGTQKRFLRFVGRCRAGSWGTKSLNLKAYSDMLAA